MLAARLAEDELEELVGIAATAMIDVFDPREVILFGSLARGDHNRASDMDLAVVAETPLPFVERIGQALEALDGVTRRLGVDVVVYTPQEWDRMLAEDNAFVRRIRKEGRVLYARS